MIEIAKLLEREFIETVLKVVERERELEEPETHLYKMLEKAENILRQLLAMNEMFSDEKM
jgi:tRNA(Ser,Leu) C12 N-acetylase TAN1